MDQQLARNSAIRFVTLLLTFSLLWISGFSNVPAADGDTDAFSQVPHSSKDKISARELEIFTDQLITRQLDEYHISGAIVAIVRDGKIELARGYGYANLEEQIPATADETLFRTGSISKVFTWTAVMQLVEQGKIDLNADINTYLPDFKIPDRFPEPITMLNLLSHTAGFEERATGTESRRLEDRITLHDYLVRYMPDRVRPAGEVITYSNYGAALAGYIVETVSGMPFEQVLERNIFEPLSMSHSTFRQPIPPDLEGLLASSYSYNGEFVAGSYDYVNLPPAATLCSSANDMASFLIAHLQNGRFGDRQILKPETALQMHNPLFSNDERLDGIAYGLFEWNFNGQRILWHSGDIGDFHSGLALLPEQDLGFFVSYNSNAGYLAVNEFYASFVDAFFPAQPAGVPLPAQSHSDALEDLAGEYRSTRSVYNHIERIASFPGNGNVKITVNPDGTLSFAGLTLYQKEPFVFSPQDGSDTYIFHPDDRGKIKYLFVNSNQLWSFEPVSWYETAAFNSLALGVCYALLLTAVLAALISFFRRRKVEKAAARLAGIARVWTFSLSIVFLLVLPVVAVYITSDYKSPFPAYMVAFLAIILAASILVIGPVCFTVLAWWRSFWGRAERIHYTFLTAALLGMVWLMYYWRLFGFRF